MSLWMLREKENGFVTTFDNRLKEGHATRLRDIGLEEGESVRCLKVLPFGGPRVFQIRDSVFSLEKAVAHKVLSKRPRFMQKILLVGKPNSGKTLLFNQLTGLMQKVANFPGVTVEVKQGTFGDLELIDFPGVYSIDTLTRDEEIAVKKFREFLSMNETKLVVCVLDATRIERSLVFGLQAMQEAQRHNKAFVFVLNMMDEISKKQQTVDVKELERELLCPVLAVSSKTGEGLEHLKKQLKSTTDNPTPYIPRLSIGNRKELIVTAKKLGQKFGVNPDIILKGQNHWDRFFLHSVAGGIAFFIIMVLFFQSIFTWSIPLMDFTEAAVSEMSRLVTGLVGEGILRDFFDGAIFGGIGAFLVFVPQIMVLTFVVGLLEDSGFLARASLIVHRPLSYFGLTGKSFVPYLSGMACAIPAIMAARTIESPKKRMITIMTIPLMSCSARLPVYSLLITALIPATPFLGGLVTLQGLTFFAIFLFGIITALIISILLNRFSPLGIENDIPFMIELPPYRLPHIKSLLIKSIDSAKSFVVNAGGIIFCVSVTIWILGHLPLGADGLENSWLAGLGRLVEPVFAPLGLDWRYAVAILTSFLAREVFVGTLGTLFGMEGADENIAGLALQIRADGLELSAALGLLVFYAIALQCVSTMAVMKKEMGSAKAPIIVFFCYSTLAYLLAIAVRWGVSSLQ